MRSLLAFVVLTSALAAATTLSTAPDRVIGTVQPEIRLADGTVFKNAKVLDASPAKGTATLSDSTRIRTVYLKDLPPALREQVLAEIARGDAPRFNTYPDEPRATPGREKVATPATPAPPIATPSTSPAPPVNPPAAATPAPPATPEPSITQRLIAQATDEAPEELKFYLLRAYERVSGITTKVRRAEQVPGWQKIRVSGDASFSVWDNSRRDYVWRTDKFEVEFAIVNGASLKLDNVSFGGISRPADPNY